MALSQWGGQWAATAYAMIASIILGAGWPHLQKVPARQTLAVVISAIGILAALTAAYSAEPGLANLIPVMALGVLATFLVQLFRGTGRPYRLQSLLGATAATYITALGAGWIALARLDQPGLAYVAAASGFVAAFFVRRDLPAALKWAATLVPLGIGLLTGWFIELDWAKTALAAVITTTTVFILQLVAQRSMALPSNRSLAAAALTAICSLGTAMFYLQVIADGGVRQFIAQ